MSKNVHFSANQIALIDWLAHCKYDRTPSTQALLAEKLGVSEKTVSRWAQNPELQEAVNVRSWELLGSKLPEYYGALSREAEKGSYQHLKLVMEMLGKYTPRQELTGANGGEVRITVVYDS